MWSSLVLPTVGRINGSIRQFSRFSTFSIKSLKSFPAFSHFLLRAKRITSSNSNRVKVTALSIGYFLVNAASSVKQSDMTESQITLITREADGLFDEDQFEKVLELLRPYKEMRADELIWRISRAAYKLSKSPKRTKEERALLIEEAYSMAKLALELNDKSAYAHKWMSVALDAHSALLGFRSRCMSLIQVKEHMLKASELDPSDASTIYMLGSWHYGIAELAWYQRKVLQAIGGQPPSATFEEALAYFKKAEETSPKFYSLNLLMLGKCHLQLGDKDTAAMYLQQAASYPKHTEDDHQAHKEAAELLAKLKKT